MKVLHKVITEKAYKNALERSEMNHRTETPSFLFYGKGRYDKILYIEKGKVRSSKCSFISNEVIPFDLNDLDDLQYFNSSYHTFINNITKGQNHSVSVCEVDSDGNLIRDLEEYEVLDICNRAKK